MESLLELWRQPSVRLSLVGEQGVSTGLRTVQKVQDGGARRLLLISTLDKQLQNKLERDNPYVTSECQVTEFVLVSKKSLEVVSSAPRCTR